MDVSVFLDLIPAIDQDSECKQHNEDVKKVVNHMLQRYATLYVTQKNSHRDEPIVTKTFIQGRKVRFSDI